MNTKTFAQQSRNLLMDGVAKKLLYWGFNIKGEVLESPQQLSGGYEFRGEVFNDLNVPQLWEALKKAVQHKGMETVVEEAAYTWFNRMLAIRIMAKNGYDQPQLEDALGLEHTPVLLQKARQGQYAYLNITEQQRLKKIIGDYSKDQEAFALLLVSYCHNNTMLHRVFGKIDDYTELLLPDNMLQDSGFLHLLNTTDAISDAEYKEVELIGWLYQFYISEKKDDVFASFKKGKKAEAKDIPAATAIFTPSWIVKYMVQNTAGKIWLDKHPDSPLKDEMKYLVENNSDSASEPIIDNVEELTLIDPAAGSGHILVEGFDLLYQMYMEEYYAPEEAVEAILKNNLYGLDIDDRAAQLATFAILLKAATKYRDVFNESWLPNVYAMPEAQDFSLQELKDFLGKEGEDYVEELGIALRLMKQAKNLGTVMKLSLNEETRNHIKERYTILCNNDYLDLNVKSILQGIKNYIPILLILTKKYAAVVANPPYMGQKNMNVDLKNYVNINYPLSKNDLYTIFIEEGINKLISGGKIGLINPPSWMFTTSFAALRMNILSKASIDSLLNLGRGVFGVDFGSTCYVITNLKFKGKIGVYRNLFREKVTVDTPKQKEAWFFDKKFKIFRNNQENFLKIKDTPLAFWLPERVFDFFEKHTKISNYVDVKVGLQTGYNDKFRRSWHEPSIKSLKIDGYEDGVKWFPYNSGGLYRKWYGNHDYVVNWLDKGSQIKNFKNEKGKVRSRAQNTSYYFKESGAWSKMTASGLTLRYYPKGFIFDVSGCSFFGKTEDLFYLIGLLNSPLKIPFIDAINQSFNYEVGQISNVPVKIDDHYNSCLNIVEELINQSKIDWDSREKSWCFQQSGLLNESSNLKTAYHVWEKDVTKDLFQLHANEEELNRTFINIYGLQEELTPEVALKDITILQEELHKKELEALEEDFRAHGKDTIILPIDKAEVMSQFISYGIGLFMGRYRLDQPGLNIAHPDPTLEELESYSYNDGKVIIDEDAIIPLMGKNCNFPDDAVQQFQELLDTIWGHDTRTDNVNFIQDCLDTSIEKFLVKDFYKYHCSMYKKKPIYWLFASPKGAFQVLVYMHRMNAFTVEKIRANYLLEHIKNLGSEKSVFLSNESNLSTEEAKRLDQLRKDITECETYDLELKDVADSQIVFDLDDGVTVNYEKFKTVVAKIK